MAYLNIHADYPCGQALRKNPRPLCDAVETAVAGIFVVPLSQLRKRSRGAASVAFARQSAMYLAHVVFSLSYAEVGRAFRRDRTTAAYACRLIEERRDDPVFDALLSALEDACLSLRHRRAAEAGP
jgi:chromosomal replication initiation ATPase DnaA